MTDLTSLATTTVNDLLRRAPWSGAVLNRFGVDTCCGGALSLKETARATSVRLESLLAALTPALEGEA